MPKYNLYHIRLRFEYSCSITRNTGENIIGQVVWEETGVEKGQYKSIKKKSQKTGKWIISYPKDISRAVLARKPSMWSQQLVQDNKSKPLL